MPGLLFLTKQTPPIFGFFHYDFFENIKKEMVF